MNTWFTYDYVRSVSGTTNAATRTVLQDMADRIEKEIMAHMGLPQDMTEADIKKLVGDVMAHKVVNPENATDTDFCFQLDNRIHRVREWTDKKLWIFMREDFLCWVSLRHVADGEMENLRALKLSPEEDDYYRHETRHMKKAA